MKHMGLVIDKWVTSYVTEVHLPSGRKYVRFPFFEETEYQKTRYYKDDKLLEFYKLEYMRIPKPWIEGLK